MARAYYLGNIPEDQKFRGQARLIIDQLLPAKTPDDAKTVKELAEAIKPALQTRQDPERVVAFYMAVWKKKGFVRFYEQAKPESAAGDGAGDGETREVPMVPDANFPDLTGKKLSEAVVEVMRWRVQPLTTEGVANLMTKHGFPIKENQVQSALQNLERKELVSKVGETYELKVPVAV